MLRSFSWKNRQHNLQVLESTDFDLCVVGGGITGAGVARDAASRGMKVCVLEQSDFASGTSSRSSKLIHGGIRYLENLEFGLVFEALSERHILFQIAPHLVHPLSFVLPVYKDSRVGMFKLGLGMLLYDFLSMMHAPKFHEHLNPDETQTLVPSLDTENLSGGYIYSDAYMDDDRLVLETLRSAHSHGAILTNYIKVDKGEFDENQRLTSVTAIDQKTKKQIKVRAKHFVSTVGPWTDQFGASLDKKWKSLLRPSKGIHLTLKRDRLPLEDAVVMAEGKRIIFAIPRHEMIIIGTTDTDYPGDPSEVTTSSEDVTYLLKVVGEYFPHAKITEKDLVASYAGVRPLVHDGSSSESKTSREHLVLPTKMNITFVAGGKYTTYRRMARDIVEVVLKNEFCLEERVEYARNQTRDPINPLVTPEKLAEAKAQSPSWAEKFGVTEQEAFFMAERHGFEGLKILEKGQSLGYQNIWEMEADFAINETMCLHLRDFMLRRSPLFLAQPDHGEKFLEGIIGVFKKHYGWDAKTIEEEKKLYQNHMKTELGWRGNLS